MDEVTAATIAEGRDALERGDWERARTALAALAEAEVPEALEGYGHALWFLGHVDEAIELRERACLAFGARGECDRAARLAAWVSHQYLATGRTSLSNGWLARADRALEGRTDCSGAGWVAVERARRAGTEECLQGARLGLELARSAGDGDLEVFALSLLGRAEIAAGRFERGMEHLEEAMAAATAGRSRNLNSLGEAYCTMIDAATSAGDWERATEWCRLVAEFSSSRSIQLLYGVCRTKHADVLAAAGRWSEAEAALDEAVANVVPHNPAFAVPAAASLALLRIRQGRLAEAEQLLGGRGEDGVVLLALAELRLAAGEPAVAAALLERALERAGGDLFAGSRLLVRLVDAELAAGQPPRARAALERLLAIAAQTSGRPLVQAQAALATARLALAEGDPATANAEARVALDAFGRLGMPHEAAEARLELARAVAADLPALALDEARAALAVLRELGATRTADLAAALVRDLGGGSAPGARIDGGLTSREAQVLDLLVEGLTNAQIAQRLFISEKTAGHHVSRILQKLGARNRAEAAAYAARPA
ncbi:MAG: LuxR C-terminal-related transcriptional regulator [Thermoleophilia bacterium]